MKNIIIIILISIIALQYYFNIDLIKTVNNINDDIKEFKSTMDNFNFTTNYINQTIIERNILENNENTYNEENYINFQKRTIRFCGDDAKLYTAVGMSMFPYSWEGGYYYAEFVEWDDIELGDVITYSRANKSNVHHVVVNIYKDRLYTMGYNNNKKDVEAVYPEQVLSRDCFMKNE